MTDHKIVILVKETENKNTQKATKWAVNVYEDWKYSKIGSGFIIPNLKDLTVQDINSILGKFVLEDKKKNREIYHARTLHLFVTGLLRGIRPQGCSNLNFLNESDDRFLKFRQILDTQMKQLTSDGYDINVKQADPISVEQEELLWDSLRGRDEHRNLQISQTQLGGDYNGNYIEFRGQIIEVKRLFVPTNRRPADFLLKDMSNTLNPSTTQIKIEQPKSLTENDNLAILVPKQDNAEN
ncbi:unnamed protein product [Mytilus coruscus]|uniref:Uncharacterized protein n=1 Tax=Mytilus coruscus TaxID=42192 RepID=A0A6J8DAI8_MYTCO|nr:unnamed protein product [Mytilus coruscus]